MTNGNLSAKEVSFQAGPVQLKGYLATPKGVGQFSTVIYLHGGRGTAVGGDPQATAEALAKSGFVGFAPISGRNSSLARNIEEVIAAVDYVKNIEYVDEQRLAIVGFSRGGLLAFMASTQRRDLNAVVLMAPAHGQGTLRRFLSRADGVTAPRGQERHETGGPCKNLSLIHI